MWVESPHQKKSWLSAVLVLAIFLMAAPILQEWVQSIHYPISGEHNHRQADTFSVALNFLKHPNFFYPRVHHTYGRTGIHGMEAPIVPYTASLWMRMFGEMEWMGRVNTLCYFLLGLIALLFYLRMAPGPHSSFLVGSVLLFSPMTLFYSRQIQPDMPMVCIGLLGVALAYRSRRKHWRSLLLATLVFSAGVLTKYPLLFVWPAFVIAAIRWRSFSWKDRLVRVGMTCLPLLLVGIWMLWASYLEKRFATGLPQYFAATPKPSEIWNNIRNFQLGHTVGYILPKYATDYTFFPIVVYGLLSSFQRKYREWAAPVWTWMLGALLLVLMFTSRLHAHYYYAILYLPPVWIFGALGLHRIWRWLKFPALRSPSSNDTEQDDTYQDVPWVLAIWLALFLTQGPWQWQQAAVVVALSLYMGFSALGPRVFEKTHQYLRPVLVLGITLFLCFTSLKASHARFHERCHRLGDPYSFTTRSQDLRKMLAPYVRKDEAIVMIADYNPWYLHAAARTGWTHFEHVLFRGSKDLDYYRKLGVRWLVVNKRVTRHTPSILRGKSPFARTGEWWLYWIGKTPSPARRQVP